MEERKVNLFLVGAMKAGTTSFVDSLSQHPSIYVSPIKEPHFFVDNLPKELYEPSKYFDLTAYFENNFPNTLHIAHVRKKKHYKKLFSLASKEPYLLEASTMYLHAPNVAKNIKSYNADAKIIILVRNPLQRAFSHYNMLVSLSRETRSFETVMKKDMEAYEKNRLPWYSCLGMSFYKSRIELFQAHFKEVYIVEFENYVQNKTVVLNDVLKLLQLEPLSIITEGKLNAGRTIRFKWLFYLMNRIGVKDYFSLLVPNRFRLILFKILSKEIKKDIKLEGDVREKLNEIFRKESL